jgi:hypothetical protein
VNPKNAENNKMCYITEAYHYLTSCILSLFVGELVRHSRKRGREREREREREAEREKE